MKFHVLALLTLLFASGCCSPSKETCEEGLTVTIEYDTPSKIKEMTVRWKTADDSGKAIFRPKEKRFFIDETHSVIGDKVTIDVVLDDAVISTEAYPVEWERAVCGKTDGPRWCADDTYEWAKINIDLVDEEELQDK
jgi:flagellar basal body L-ring protein FlgH